MRDFEMFFRTLFGVVVEALEEVIGVTLLVYTLAALAVAVIAFLLLGAPILYILGCTVVGALPFGQKLLAMAVLSLIPMVLLVFTASFLAPLFTYEGGRNTLRRMRQFFGLLAAIPLIFVFVPIGNGILIMIMIELFALSLLLLGGPGANGANLFARKFILWVALPTMVILLLAGGLHEAERKKDALGAILARRSLSKGRVSKIVEIFPSSINRTNNEEVIVPAGGEYKFETAEPRLSFAVHTPPEMDCCVAFDIEYIDGTIETNMPPDFNPNSPGTRKDHYRAVRAITVHNNSTMDMKAYSWWVPSA